MVNHVTEKVKNSLQNFYNSLGERAKKLIINNDKARALFDRYSIEYKEEQKEEDIDVLPQ